MFVDRLPALVLIATCAGGIWSPVLAARAIAPPEPEQRFTVQDLVRLDRISDPAVSPDGKQVAYTLRTTDMEANKGRTGVWVVDARKHDAAPVRLTDIAANANSPEWSADGRSIYFLSSRSGSSQVWRVDVGRHGAPANGVQLGSETQQITNLPLEVGSFRVSPKGDRLLVSMEVFTDCADLACTQKRLAVVSAAASHGVLYDKLFVRHWDTWSDGRRSQLFAIALDAAGLANGTPRNLTAGIDGDVPSKPFGGREDYAVSQDGQSVAFSVRLGTVGEPWSTNFDIYRVAITGGKQDNLTADNPAWDGQPAFSADGSKLAYLAMDRPGFEADKFHLVLIDLKSGAKRSLTQQWDRSISNFAWSRDSKVIFATTDHLGQHPLWAIDIKTGRESAITGDGEVEGYSVGPKQVLYTQSTLGSPADLYTVGFEGGAARQVTHVNQAVLSHRTLAAYEQFNFPGWHAENVYGYVVKPADFNADHKYPVAFMVHGGPQGSFGNEWHWRWNAQTLAGAGYAVVMVDFHGSTGYGQAFTDSISGDWGGKPLEDLKAGLAAALKQYPWLDGDRVCALGGSYGGFMMNWILGQWPDRFKCIVTHDGIFDNRSMYYSTEELWFAEWENGGAPEYANPAGYAKFNPVDYVSKWQTPTLVIHGQLDYRVPYAQGLSVFTALQRRGIPSEFLYFPDENHWVLKPANSIQWYDTVIAWMNRWTGNGAAQVGARPAK
jgi:dipeptidyl aminopeptidase/acylaminoacyl peptidase